MILDRAGRLEDAPYERERHVWDTFDLLFTDIYPTRLLSNSSLCRP